MATLTTSNDYETVRAELKRVDHLAYRLYKTTLELRMRGLCDACESRPRQSRRRPIP